MPLNLITAEPHEAYDKAGLKEQSTEMRILFAQTALKPRLRLRLYMRYKMNKLK